ncbi:AI-2E family transporter YdiK [Pseudaminobacter sp. 19-2017]|uniref:AI-2E family transporter YdiK n=1 Tax=Pseudaminobacter soli (ex Zhang et al. 2022) TaxID=2831468 RepID=A0A942I486_9HYPH|nr:AI-2E family transporter YdiK [Pseudaminobacter soli]MBS3651528.1 AI-2E family transporter YdiK [Pseudaminobacter soli]
MIEKPAKPQIRRAGFADKSSPDKSNAAGLSGSVESHQDLGRITLTVLFIVGLLVGSLWIILPLLPAILWASTLVLATWPLLKEAEHLAGGRRWVAVVLMTAGTLLMLVLPLWLAISVLLSNMDVLGRIAENMLSLRVPAPPDWLASVPIVGQGLADGWRKLASAGLSEFAPKLAPYARTLTLWLGSTVGSLGAVLLQFLLTTIIAAILYAKGEAAGATALLFGRRLAGERGEKAVVLAGQAIRSVALGIVVTAFAQSIIGGIGLWLVGMPLAALLTALMFVLCLIQIGPALVLFPAVVWMYYAGDALWATVLLGFSIVACTIDQVIRPILIRRGADLPILLIVAGVIGGLIAFGILGIFIGPTILAVAYTLLNAWMGEAVTRHSDQ